MPGLSLNAILLSAVALLAPSVEAVDAGRHDSELGAVEVTRWLAVWLSLGRRLPAGQPGHIGHRAARQLAFRQSRGQLSAPLEGVPRVFASGQGDCSTSPCRRGSPRTGWST